MPQHSNDDRLFSFEFYPPKTDRGRDQLERTVTRLRGLQPDYVSVTFGAAGSTQVGTTKTVVWLREQGLDAAPHLSCIGTTREQIRGMLEYYVQHDIRRIVALRGDLPSGDVDRGDFHYANELVAFIRAETGNHFHIEVAAYPEVHPQAASPTADLANFARKVRAGANGAITQYFFNADAYLRFVDACRAEGLDLPIVPGVMPITNYVQLKRFSDNCGAEIPRWLGRRLSEFGDDMDGLRAFGVEVISDLCRRLLEAGAPGLHFYTLNMAKATTAIWQNLGLPTGGSEPI